MAVCTFHCIATPPLSAAEKPTSPLNYRMLTTAMQLSNQAGLLTSTRHHSHPSRHPHPPSLARPGGAGGQSLDDDASIVLMSIDGDAGDAAGYASYSRGVSPSDSAGDEADGQRREAGMRAALMGLYRECLREVLSACR